MRTGFHARTSVSLQISPNAGDYFWGQQTNPRPRGEMSLAPIQKRISRTAFCASQICRLSPWIVSAAANTCCGGKRGKLYLRWSRYGAAIDSRTVQPFRSRSGGASPAISPKSSGDDPRSQRRARRSLLWRIVHAIAPRSGICWFAATLPTCRRWGQQQRGWQFL
jgi:hypothetical protein